MGRVEDFDWGEKFWGGSKEQQKNPMAEGYIPLCKSSLEIMTFPETNSRFAPENRRREPKEISSSSHQFLGAFLC